MMEMLMRGMQRVLFIGIDGLIGPGGMITGGEEPTILEPAILELIANDVSQAYDAWDSLQATGLQNNVGMIWIVSGIVLFAVICFLIYQYWNNNKVAKTFAEKEEILKENAIIRPTTSEGGRENFMFCSSCGHNLAQLECSFCPNCSKSCERNKFSALVQSNDKSLFRVLGIVSFVLSPIIAIIMGHNRYQNVRLWSGTNSAIDAVFDMFPVLMLVVLAGIALGIALIIIGLDNRPSGAEGDIAKRVQLCGIISLALAGFFIIPISLPISVVAGVFGIVIAKRAIKLGITHQAIQSRMIFSYAGIAMTLLIVLGGIGLLLFR